MSEALSHKVRKDDNKRKLPSVTLYLSDPEQLKLWNLFQKVGRSSKLKHEWVRRQLLFSMEVKEIKNLNSNTDKPSPVVKKTSRLKGVL